MLLHHLAQLITLARSVTRLSLLKPTVRVLTPIESSSGVSTVGEYRLTCNPPTLGSKESYDRHNVLNLGEIAVQGLRLVKSHSFRHFLAVEKRRVHRAGTDRGHGNTARTELLGRCAGKVFHRRFAAGVGRIAVGEGREQ